MPHVLLIRNKPETIWDNEQFARLLNELLGADAADYFLNALKPEETECDSCVGECEHTYEIQEHWETIVRDIQDELMHWPVRKLTKQQLEDRRDALVERIDKCL